MKKSFNFYFILLALVFSAVFTVKAQITIDSNEYDTALGTKHYFYTMVDTTLFGSGFDVNVGASGASQTWTYTIDQFPEGEQVMHTVVDPATTPAAADFPDAHHAWFSENKEDTVTVSLYQYFKYNTSELSFLGMAFVRDTSTSLMKNDPPEKILPFPATYNTSWQNNSSFRYGVPGEIEWVDSTSSSSVVDAWGTIILPAGTFSCLRVREDATMFHQTYIDTMLVSADTTTEITYSWLTENTGFLASITSLTDETDPNFTLASHVSIRTNGEVGIGQNNSGTLHSFELKQNYPNPFNPSTAIQYNLTQRTNVELAVYDQQGRKVALLFHGEQNAGIHTYKWNADGFASGVYFYQLKTNEGLQQTKKLILLR